MRERIGALPRLVAAAAVVVAFVAVPVAAQAEEPAADGGAGIAQVANQITVTKVVQPLDPAQTFTFQLRLCPTAACLTQGSVVETQQISLGGGVTSGTVTFSTVLANQNPGLQRYRIVEVVPDGFRFLSASCTGNGTETPLPIVPGVQFRHTTGTAWDCTFENAANRITVTKLTDPAGAPRDFEVNVEQCEFNILANCIGDAWVPLAGTPLVLSHGETVTLAGGDLIDPEFFDRFFRVRETDPGSQWTVSVECTGRFGLLGNGSPTTIPFGQAFAFSPLARVPAIADCAITNATEVGSITVEKETQPRGGEDFEFSLRDLDDPSNPSAVEFSLDDGESRKFANLFPSGPNGYVINETDLADGWSLEDIDCADASIRRIAHGVVVTLARGEAVECTFTNEGDPRAEQKPVPITVNPTFTG